MIVMEHGIYIRFMDLQDKIFSTPDGCKTKIRSIKDQQQAAETTISRP